MFRLFICWEIHGTQVCIPLKPLFSRHKRTMVQFTDEPTGNLDSQTELEVMSLLKSCVSDFGQTLIMITHDETIAQMADEMIIIEDGKAVRR